MFELFAVKRWRALPPPEPFLMLPENQFAHAALSRLSQPLEGSSHRTGSLLTYLHGPAGVGKSHLTRVALREALRRRPKLRVLPTTAEELAVQAVIAAESQLAAEFHQQCRELDLLICEDLHLLEQQPELVPTFGGLIEELLHAETHVLLTSRIAPGELKFLPARFINRCQGGLCAAMRLPGPESRERLLQHFAAARQLPLQESVTRFLAENGPTAPRELQVLVARLEETSRRENVPPEKELARRLVTPRRLDLPEIAAAVATEFGLTVNDLRSRSRSQSLVLPRQMAMYLSRELTGQPLEQIGEYFGHRGHTTVAHGCGRLRELLPDAPTLRQQVGKIRARLTAREDCA